MPKGFKLRVPAPARPFHVVLVEPEIPPNTGSVARTCVATGSPLHLVGELGFRLDEQSVRRAGLDYWPHLELHRHVTVDDFIRAKPEARLHLFSSAGTRSYLDADVEPGDALVFGKESVGLPPELLDRFSKRTWAIPILGPVRSLNLSNAVAIVLYEALRKVGALIGTAEDSSPR